MSDAAQTHWEHVYTTRPSTQVSWYQGEPERSLAMFAAAGVAPTASVIDVGGGASLLVDRLLEQGYGQISVLDVSSQALAAAKARLGGRGDTVAWLVEDITTWSPPPHAFDLWHDRAVFHFLVEDIHRQAYLRALNQGLRDGGYLILATFALSGPERCSDLPVQRYSAETLQAALGGGFKLLDTSLETHITPSGVAQDFVWCLFRKTAD